MKTKNHEGPRPELLITRHPALRDYLLELGIIDADTPVVTHAAGSDVRGKHTVGILPLWLAAQAQSHSEIPMRLTPKDREDMQRGDLSLERVRAVAGDLRCYAVHDLGPAGQGGIDVERPRWLALAEAWRYVERIGTHFGAGPAIHGEWSGSLRGCCTLLIIETTQSVSAEVCPSRGVWRAGGEMVSGLWFDGFGREVALDDIEPAEGWKPEQG